MDYEYSNLYEYNEAMQQHALFGVGSNSLIEYKERFWSTLDQFPARFSKQKIQEFFYSKVEQSAGHRLYTLREIADNYGRPLRRYISGDKDGLNDYLNKDFYFLFIDIDDPPKGVSEKILVTYDVMVSLVKNFKSADFPEVYVRPSHSTESKPWKFHLYIRCRDPYYYRLVQKGQRKRLERENTRTLPEYKMVQKFLDTFRRYFTEFFRTHEFSKVDTALFSIHQCFHGAPATGITHVMRKVLPDTVIGFVPCKDLKKDPYYGVPQHYKEVIAYPCNASMRYKAWGITLLPCSFDVRLPSLSRWNDRKVPDGSRTAFAKVLARDLWVAVHFNLCHYGEYADPYDRDRLFRMVMREFYMGADLEDVNIQHIEDVVKYTIDQMETDSRPIDDIIEDRYADTVKKDEKGKIVVDYYKIRHPNRTSHQHVERVIGELKAEGVIKGSRLTKRGAELKGILASKHVSEQALKKRGIRSWKVRKKRSDEGRKRTGRSFWAEYVSLCRRDMDGKVVVPKDVGKLDGFRKFSSRQLLGYVTSSLPGDDPLDIDHVVDMPQEAPCEAPWGVEEW